MTAKDYFDREFKVGDIVVYSGSAQSMSHGRVTKITQGRPDWRGNRTWRLTVQKLGRAYYGRMSEEDTSVSLSKLERVVILRPLPELFTYHVSLDCYRSGVKVHSMPTYDEVEAGSVDEAKASLKRQLENLVANTYDSLTVRLSLTGQGVVEEYAFA